MSIKKPNSRERRGHWLMQCRAEKTAIALGYPESREQDDGSDRDYDSMDDPQNYAARMRSVTDRGRFGC